MSPWLTMADALGKPYDENPPLGEANDDSLLHFRKFGKETAAHWRAALPEKNLNVLALKPVFAHVLTPFRLPPTEMRRVARPLQDSATSVCIPPASITPLVASIHIPPPLHEPEMTVDIPLTPMAPLAVSVRIPLPLHEPKMTLGI
ncbi:hypothetical protein Salat_1676900 [Sesamum alatum]|uniref:Uncharacterized protein n=1 Tax=Sesamum alatum TaxID=300844 RepID=A0AAE2CJU8_9LAMI|nr:hypothetical protein Salat_1676900 [Sesamum alatum]